MLRPNTSRDILLAATVGTLVLLAVPNSNRYSQCCAGQGPIPSDRLVLRLTDPNGALVSGAKVGSSTNWSDTRPAAGRAVMSFIRRRSGVVSSDTGCAELDAERLFGNSSPGRSVPVYAYHENRGIGTLCQVSREDLSKRIDLTLRPTCRVAGKISVAGPVSSEQSLTWTNAYVYWSDLRSFSCASTRGSFEFHLPPGSYRLEVYGTGMSAVQQTFTIAPREQELKLDVQLPLGTDRLLGKRAPELQPIRGWINTPPLTMRDLAGSVVILDFWGYWCSPCIRDMPALMELQERFKDDGLVVIGIHNDTVASTEQLQEHVRRLEEKHWGRRLPFAVALDGEHTVRRAGVDVKTGGATVAAYGIEGYPTTFLTDQQGIVVQRFAANNPEHLATLRDLLGQHKTSRQFETTYALAGGEALRRVDPDAMMLRREVVADEERGTVFRWSHELHIDEARPYLDGTLKDVLERVIGLFDFEYDCSDEYLSLEIPGDWVVRIGSTRHERLAALQTILSRHTGAAWHVKKQRTTADVIRVTGRFGFRPLPVGTYDDSRVHVFSDTLDLDESWGGGSGFLHDFLARLSRTQIGLPIVDATDPLVPPIYFRYGCHRSGYPAKLPEGAEKDRKLQLLLSNLNRQTGLDFVRDQQPVDIWRLVRDHHDR